MKLLAFPFHDWRKAQEEGLRTRDHHVLEWLARTHAFSEVLVVDRPVSAAERLTRRRGWHVKGELVAERSGHMNKARVTRVGNGLLALDSTTRSVFSPLAKRRGWWFDAFADKSTIATIEWAVDLVGPFDACIAWLPTVVPALQAVQVPFVFDSLDNWLIHPTYAPWRAQAEEAYRWVADAAVELFVAAPASQRVFQQWRSDVTLLPNGVDVDLFTDPRPRPADMPVSPVVGYAGKLGGRLDVELVAAVAERLPRVNFVLVGPVLERNSVKPLTSSPNVTFLGDRHYSLLPAYLQSFDVAWIPHRVGPGETGGDLIKRYEYWAAGKHVISTRIDGWEEWADSVDLVDGIEEAVSAIESFLDGTTKPLVPAIPSERTWQSIAGRLVEPFEIPDH